MGLGEGDFVIVDGTLIPTDRIAADELYYSQKHKRHGMNMQVIARPDSTPLWFSRALPGRTHDLTAARARGIIQACLTRQILVFADRAYQGAGSTVRTPYNNTTNNPSTTSSSTVTTPGYETSSRRTRLCPAEDVPRLHLGEGAFARCTGVVAVELLVGGADSEPLPTLLVMLMGWALLCNDECSWYMGCRPRSTFPPGASWACLPVVDRLVHSQPAVPDRAAHLPAKDDRHPVAAGRRPSSPARPGSSTVR